MRQQVPAATVLVVSAALDRRDSVARFLEWELPEARILVASHPDQAILVVEREVVHVLVVDGLESGAEDWLHHTSLRTTRRVYLADDSRGLTESGEPGPRFPDARPLDYRRLLAQVKRALPARRAP